MNPEQVTKLEPGLYRIHWRLDSGGGTSLASVGLGHDGKAWMACCNWLGTSNYTVGNTCHWDVVLRIEPILLAKDAAKIPAEKRLWVCTMSSPFSQVNVGLGNDVNPKPGFERAWANMIDELTGKDVLPTQDIEITLSSERSYERVVCKTTPAAEPMTHPCCSYCGVSVSEEYRRYHDRCVSCRGK